MNTYFIYKICCEDPLITDFYIGSSKNIRDRKSKHKSACNKETDKSHNYKIYQTIRENGGWDNFRMVVIEELPDTTRIAAQIREEHWRVTLSATLNSISAYSGLSKEEYNKKYYFDNQKQINENCKKYYETNKEQLIIQSKEYYQNNKETISNKKKIYREDNKEQISNQQKEYREQNKEAIRNQQKKYEEENKEKRQEKASQKNDCICGGKYTNGHKSTHMKTPKHLNYIQNQI